MVGGCFRLPWGDGGVGDVVRAGRFDAKPLAESVGVSGRSVVGDMAGEKGVYGLKKLIVCFQKS